MLVYLVRGISLGFTAGSIPGPLQTYLINTTVTYGWRGSLIAVFSPLLADLPIIVLTVFLLGQFPPAALSLLQIIGGGFILWLAWGAWRQFRAGTQLAADGATVTRRSVLSRALVINLFSPGPYIFWATVNGPLFIEALEQSVLHAAGFVVGFYGTFISFLTVLVFTFDRVRRLDQRVTRGILLVAALILLVFGVQLVVQGVQGLRVG